jgi:hypothetical protein
VSLIAVAGGSGGYSTVRLKGAATAHRYSRGKTAVKPRVEAPALATPRAKLQWVASDRLSTLSLRSNGETSAAVPVSFRSVRSANQGHRLDFQNTVLRDVHLDAARGRTAPLGRFAMLTLGAPQHYAVVSHGFFVITVIDRPGWRADPIAERVWRALRCAGLLWRVTFMPGLPQFDVAPQSEHGLAAY